MSAAADGQTRLGVGCRIRTTDGSNATGEIVEDFGSLAGTEVRVDAEHTARGRRWAVALDDGRVVFVDDDAIEPVE
ncbi:MAG: hypothetical protein JO280_18305 [Mycobacteriaceae bacterium]|nr:hypothetical protein [Mycobacteriaceae bacterium]